MSKKRNKKKNHSRLYVIEAVAVIGLALGAGIFTMVRAAGTLTDEQNAIKIDGKTIPRFALEIPLENVSDS